MLLMANSAASRHVELPRYSMDESTSMDCVECYGITLCFGWDLVVAQAFHNLFLHLFPKHEILCMKSGIKFFFYKQTFALGSNDLDLHFARGFRYTHGQFALLYQNQDLVGTFSCFPYSHHIKYEADA